MKKLWDKGYIQNKELEEFCYLGDGNMDTNIVPHDVWGSIAHAKMLAKIGILTDDEFKKLQKSLVKILKLHEEGKFTVDMGDEDVHTKVENFLIKELGDLGKKIHTGRSRNDQVLVDMRLYVKEQILITAQRSLPVIEAFLAMAKKHEFVPMPGYTHMRRAMPSSVGLWAASFAESLIADLAILKNAYALTNQNHLGSGAAYGVSLSIDRELTSKLLGFAKVQNNVLYGQATRTKLQLLAMHAYVQIMLTLDRFASDMVLFTMKEFGFFSFPKEFFFGSSIMPQKMNFDAMELLRARTNVMIGNHGIVASISAGRISGYNADFGDTKGPFVQSAMIVKGALGVVEIVARAIKPNEENLKNACTPEIYAAHQAFLMVKKGMPFRDAYRKTADSLDDLPELDPVDVLKETNHTGGPGNLGISKIASIMRTEEQWWVKENAGFQKAIQALVK